MSKIRFTKTALQAIAANGTRQTFHDTVTPGLILLVYPTGRKTFFLYQRIAGRPERIKLGTFPTVTVEQARTKAATVQGAIARDENPAAVKRSARAEPTFGEVLDQFLKNKRSNTGRPLKEKTRGEYRRIANDCLGGLLNRKLSEVTPDAARLAHRRIKSASTANQARALLSSLFNFAKLERIASLPNPAEAIRRRHVESRDRFLQSSELPRFFAAVAESPLRDFFLLALLTGARRSNLQAMCWADVNLDEGVWRIDDTKNGTPQNVTLAPEAVTILRERWETRTHGERFVFPGPGKSGHVVEPHAAFTAVLKKAGIENLRIHDLRRTLGSWQARQGASLAIIGKSLNHKTQQATAIYARLDLDPVRQSVNSATAAMLEAGGLSDSATVLPFKRNRA